MALAVPKEDNVMAHLAERNKAALKTKRSFFVRMVSDPKLYNPKIVKNIPHYESIDEIAECLNPTL